MHAPVDDDDLPDELPMTQGSRPDSLPAELPFSQESRGGSLPGELPLSQESALVPLPDELDLGDGAVSCDEALPDQLAQPVDMSPPGAGQCDKGIAERRGRKNLLMLAALSDVKRRLQEQGDDPTPQPVEVDVPELGLQLALGSSRSSAHGSADVVSLMDRDASSDAPATSVAKVISGFRVGPSIEQTLWGAMSGARANTVDADSEVRQIGAHFTQQGFHNASKALIADRLGVGLWKLNQTIPRLAAATLLADYQRQRLLEQVVTRSSHRRDLLMYLEASAYDETPLPVRLKNEYGALCARQEPSRNPTEGPAAHRVGFDSGVAFHISTSKTSQKILQSSQECGMLIRASGRIVIVKFSCLSPLTFLERAHAEALAQSQLRLSATTRASQLFDHKVRATCTDGGSANLVGEKIIAKRRGADWSSMHTLCEIHKTSLLHGKTFALLDSNVRGMIRCALSLRNGAAMGVFRKCLGEILYLRKETNLKEKDVLPSAMFRKAFSAVSR